MFKILIAETLNFSTEVISELNKTGDVTLKNITQEELQQALHDYDVIWFRLKLKIKEEAIPLKTRCRYIMCPVTGLDHIDLQACENRGIKVISLKGEEEFLKVVRSTAEHTLGLTLALLRKIPQAVGSVKEGIWDRDQFKGREIFGKKVGILGVGRLGEIVAGYFKAFGAEVYGFDIAEFSSKVCQEVSTQDELFKMSDILTIHVAYDETTHHLVSRKQLELMKPGAVIINTSRGSIIKSEDLLWALENRTIAGAALDVLENEYDLEDNRLINYARWHSDLIITPHIGGNTYESFEKTEKFLLSKLKSYLAGE